MNSGLTDDIEVQKIPVPSQLPQRLDLSGLPLHIQRSSAVEALTQQNEDLLARLSVALRRLAQIEEKLATKDQEGRILEHRLSVAQDQLLILKEKDAIQGQQFRALQSSTQQWQDQISRLETQYSELYSTSREKQRHHLETIENLGRRLKRHLRHTEKLRRLARHFRETLVEVRVSLAKQEALTKQVQAHLGQAAERIQSLAKESAAQQRQLVETYESQLKDLRGESSTLRSENLEMGRRLNHLQGEYEKRIVAENRLAAEQRQFTLFREQMETERTSLMKEAAENRAAHKSLVLELESLKKNFSEMESARTQAEAANARLNEQVETLQLLWHDKENQLLKESQKVQALQKLNQDLSGTIHQQRKEIIDLKRLLEEQSLLTEEKMRLIKGELSLLGGNKKPLAFIENTNRIEVLLAEIQSGFRRQLPAVSEPTSETGVNRESGLTESP